jgi:hypothetical protein
LAFVQLRIAIERLSQQIVEELDIRLTKLKAANDFSTDKYSGDLKYLAAASKYGSSLAGRVV